MPFFSIGVTTYDRKELLIETLASITAQTFSDFEVIVGNDNPARHISAEALGINDQRIRFINHEHNLGGLANMNALLSASQGRYFTWLDDDNLYAVNFLQVVHDALIKFDYPKCVFTSFEDFRDFADLRPRPAPSSEFKLFTGPEFLRQYLARELKAIGVMGVFEADYLKQLGGVEDIDEGGKALYCEYALMIRAASATEKIGYVDAPLAFFRLHKGAWHATERDLGMYERAGMNLMKIGIECFRAPEMKADLNQNLTNLLRWVLSDFVATTREAGKASLLFLMRYFVDAKKYLASLKGSDLYWRSVRCLVAAETWLFWALCKQRILAVAPSGLVSLAYSVRSNLLEDQVHNTPN